GNEETTNVVRGGGDENETSAGAVYGDNQTDL
ncbi:unnamed protein product, partial [Didymodactylos carnosus]